MNEEVASVSDGLLTLGVVSLGLLVTAGAVAATWLASPEERRRHQRALVGPLLTAAAAVGAAALAGAPPVLVAAVEAGAGVAVLLWWQRPAARVRRLYGHGGWMGVRSYIEAATKRATRSVNPPAPRLAGAAARPVNRHGAMLGRLVTGPLLIRGRRVLSAWTRGILMLGPPGSGKTSMLVGLVLDAPGAAYVSSTKTELFDLTADFRGQHGAVRVFNPTGLGGRRSTFVWNPLSGCTDGAVADKRARALVRGGGGAAGSGSKEFWADKASEIVRCYLLAAALSGRTMESVQAWAQNAGDSTPVELLEQYEAKVPKGWLDSLRRHLDAAPNERSGYFAAVLPAVSFMDNAAVAAACTPRGDDETDLAEFVAGTDTLYVIAGEGDRRIAPLITALTEAVFETAKIVAAARGGRLSPPLAMFLDEVANTTPVPLDHWAADSRGWGISIVAVLQDLAQLNSRWGDDAAATIFNNLPTKVVLPGVASKEDLERLAYLAGPRWDRRNAEGDHKSWETSEVVSGGNLYKLPRWHAFVAGIGPQAAIVRFVPGYVQVRRARRKLRPAADLPLNSGPEMTAVPTRDRISSHEELAPGHEPIRTRAGAMS